MKTLVAVILVIIATTQAEQHGEHDQQHHKKTQLGFFGSRGRRSIDDGTATMANVPGDANEANLKGLSNLRDSLMGLQRNVRAPKGFFGMRGKKDYDLQVAEKRALLGIQQNLNGARERSRFVEPQANEIDGYPSFLPKRAPAQGFFGVRGKKFGDYDLGGSVNDKRAPSGFVGMRGKKSGMEAFEDEDEMENPQMFDYSSLYEKRAPSGFLGVRGKRLFGEPM